MSEQHRLVRFIRWGLEVSIRRRCPAETRRVQSAKKLLRSMMGDFYGEWVIYQVEAELVALGYMSTQTTPWWRPTGNFPPVVADCEQLRTLAEACGQAVDRWMRVTLANQTLCDALLADCIDSITPPTPTDDGDFAWPFRRGGASRSGRTKRVL